MPGATDYLKGGAGGAAAGAAFGPYGAAIGAGVGMLGVYLSGDDGNSQQTQDMINQYRARYGQDLNMGPAAQADYSNFRGQQQGLANRLEAQSMGQGPSLATEQLKAGLDRNMAQQASIAASGRGGQAGVGAFTAANNAANMGMQTDQASAQARIQEQYNAQQQLGSVLGQGRQADEGVNQFNAQQQNYNMEANQKAQLQAMGLTDDQITKMMQLQQQQYAGPHFSDQLMAGGAGMYAQYSAQNALSNANKNANGGNTPTPQTGPVTSPDGSSMFGQYSRPDNG